MAQEQKIIRTVGRNNCGGRCVICVHMKDGQIEKLSTETAESTNGAYPLCACVRGLNYHKTFLGPDRLQYPMKRVGERGEGKFERISWTEAVDIIASEWKRIRDTYGPASRYVNYATGDASVFRGCDLAKRLLALDGGYLDYYNSYSSACIARATELMYGTVESGNPPEDLVNAKLILLWGHNPAETRFDCETMYYLQEAKKKGIPIVVIDPRQSDTALQLNARWIPIRPATDAALADAMAWVIVDAGLQDQDFLDRCCIGFDEAHMPDGIDPSECYLSYLTGKKDGIPKTPEWAEPITGIPAETIRALALEYAKAKPAVLLQGYGAQRHAYGEQGARGGMLLACLTGNVGISGGFASGNGLCTRNHQPELPMPKNPMDVKIPVFLWTDAVSRGHEMTALDGVKGDAARMTDVKMILNLAGNSLINQHSDINTTAALLKDTSKCEFIVCSDLFMTASAKFADILLPGTSMFEEEALVPPWHFGDFLGYCSKVLEPLGESRFEYEWLSEVAEKLGLGEAFTEGRTTSQWLKHIYEEVRKKEPELPDYEAFKAEGIYRYRNHPDGIAFKAQREDPEKNPFPTPSGKIEIFSETVWNTEFKEPFPAIPCYVEPPEGATDALAERYPIQLIGWHTKRRTHTIHDNNLPMHPIDPQRLWMHPTDAEKRGIAEGDEVLVWNDRGRTQIAVHLSERIMPGVAALSQGAWYSPDADGTDRGGSINVLTSLDSTPYARGNPQHTNLVEICRAEEGQA